MQRSMALLKHKRIELMQVHNLVDLDAHLKTLRRWKAEGKIKYIGVTHYTTSSYPDLIAIIEREKLDFVQFNYSVTTREAEKRLLPLCADKGVAVLVNRAFEDGNLFTQVQGKALPAWAAEFGAKSWAQVFLKFVLAHPAVTCVIPATGKLRNLVDNLAAAMGALPDAKQRAQIVAEFSYALARHELVDRRRAHVDDEQLAVVVLRERSGVQAGLPAVGRHHRARGRGVGRDVPDVSQVVVREHVTADERRESPCRDTRIRPTTDCPIGCTYSATGGSSGVVGVPQLSAVCSVPSKQRQP